MGSLKIQLLILQWPIQEDMLINLLYRKVL